MKVASVLFLVNLFILLFSLVQAEKWTKFVCEDFDPTSKDICVKVDRTVIQKKKKVRECEEGKKCPGYVWKDPDYAGYSMLCQTIPDPIPKVNWILPGDFCKETKECYGDDDKKSCQEGVCTTKVKVGDSCQGKVYPTSWLCPVGSYWKQTEKGWTCVAQKKYGEKCNDFYDCPTGLVCHDGAKTDTYICDKWWSVDIGKQFRDLANTSIDGFFTIHSICKSGHSIRVPSGKGFDKTECREAHISLDTSDADLRRPDGPADYDCKFQTQDNPNDGTKVRVETDRSYCGWNKDNAAYCGKRKGDHDFKAALAKLQELPIDEINCHVYSELKNCASASKILTKDIYNQYKRALMTTVETQGRWALYSNNDECVKKSITQAYWSLFSEFQNNQTTTFVEMML